MDIEILCNTPDAVLFANISENARRHGRWLAVSPAHDGHAVLVGSGPSLAEHLSSLHKRIELGQTVFALNGAAKFLNGIGIVPDHQVLLDARPQTATLIGRAHHHLIASQCHPGVFSGLRNVTLWHPAIEGIDPSLPEHDASYCLVGGGISVGLSAMCLVWAMGYRKLHLYGYDSSHREGDSHAFAQPINEPDMLCRATMGGKTFVSSLTMARQAELFPGVCDDLICAGCIITVESGGLIAQVVAENRKLSQKGS